MGVTPAYSRRMGGGEHGSILQTPRLPAGRPLSPLQWSDLRCHHLAVSAGEVPCGLPGGCRGGVPSTLPTRSPCPAAHPSAPQAKSERNYHIFYEMLVGLPAQQRQRYCLQGAETYYYLNQVASPCLLLTLSRGLMGSLCATPLEVWGC